MGTDTGERINVDFDRTTGALLSGWPAVEQGIREGLLTDFGVRIMREYYGSLVPRALGRLINQQNSLALISSIASHIDVFEPRFSVVQVVPTKVTRSGSLELEIVGDYLPRALLGDFTVADRRTINAALLAN